MRYSRLLFLFLSALVLASAVLPAALEIKTSTGTVVLHGNLIHFGAFLVLAFLMDLSFPAWSIGKKLLYLCSYGLLIEGIQYFLPNRSCSAVNLLSDCVAAALCFFALRLTRLLQLRNTTEKL